MSIKGKRVLNIRLFPLLFALFATSVIIAIYFRYVVALIIFVAFLLLAGTLAFLNRKDFEKLLTIILCAVVFSVGMIEVYAVNDALREVVVIDDCTAVGVVVKTNTQTQEYGWDGVVQFTVDGIDINGNSEKGLALYRGHISAFKRDGISPDVGDIVVMRNSSVKRIDPIEDNNLYCKGYRYLIESNDVNLNGQGKISALRKFKNSVLVFLYSHCGNRAGGLIYALLFGDRDFFDYDFYRNFSALGVAHIFAVSGLHLAVIYGALRLLLKLVKCPAVASSIISFIAVVLFTYLCNFSPSVLRAAIFVFAHLFCEWTKRRYDGITVWAFTALTVALIDPYYLLNYSFLLSFGSVFSMILLVDPISRLLKKMPRMPEKLRSALSLQLAITIGGLPMTAILFGQASIPALPVNLIFIPLFALFYPVMIACVFIPYLIPAMSFLLYPINWLINSADVLFNTINVLQFRVDMTMSVVSAILFIVTCFACSKFFMIDKRIKNVLTVILAAVTTGTYVSAAIM